MLKKFCYKCGKEEYREGLCKDCLFRENPLISEKSIDVLMCKKCRRMKYRREWTKHLKDIILDRIKINKKYDNCVADVALPPELKRDNHLLLRISGSFNGQEFHENLPIMVRIRTGICPICHKIYSNYVEAVIQVRGFDMEKTKKIFSKYKTYISKMEDKISGVDAHFISKAVAQKAVMDFKGTVQRSAELKGMKKGRNVYKLFMAVRPKFDKETT